MRAYIKPMLCIFMQPFTVTTISHAQSDYYYQVIIKAILYLANSSSLHILANHQAALVCLSGQLKCPYSSISVQDIVLSRLSLLKKVQSNTQLSILRLNIIQKSALDQRGTPAPLPTGSKIDSFQLFQQHDQGHKDSIS